jgi:23S rRNA (cytidine1920-2'-O)/16S rRNA (cytidine1409-2'-O)-methyltransferase
LPRRRRAPFVALTVLLARRHPGLDPVAIPAGRVLVDGRAITNPRARVRADASLRVLPVARLRGDVKLSHALDALAVPVSGRIAVDVGASAGGFTTALLDRGARRVYAVDAGSDLLVDRLRRDPRVIDLGGCNLGVLDRGLVPEAVDVVTVDLSYLSLAGALPQLEPLDLHGGSELVALVKPTFELRRGNLAAGEGDVGAAVAAASVAAARAGWRVVATCPAPATGRRGAREVFIRAVRATAPIQRS